MGQAKLSICIPTFNREPFLRITLDSIACQLTDDLKEAIQIVVSDNASQDNTEVLVESYRGLFPHLVYYRWPENMGADRNYLKVVELASSDYCWLMGSDDILSDGSIRKVMETIGDGTTDILLFDRLLSDMKPSSIPRREFFVATEGDLLADSRKDFEGYLHYIRKSQSLGAYFSFISSLVFRKNRWDDIPDKDRFVGTAYAHVYILMKIIAQGALFRYCQTPVVTARLGNDGFLKSDSLDDFYQRVRLDIDGYCQIVNKAFGSDSYVSYKLLNKIEDIIPKGTLYTIYARQRRAKQDLPTKMELLLLNNGFYRKYISIKIKALVKKLSFR
ncbi:glycosyltransferase family 2 protein [Geobacter sp. FeAm09]|uniref:glycosyltransferase family 2 protein n=1 Tax=Geobacter sp. FeAm09 TaxID=2597769 RepID=UPI00143CE48E|nr:glycosyltransferase family 2 protein [Geobacter sp. FeAm09]